MAETTTLPALNSKTAVVRWKRATEADLELVQVNMASLAEQSKSVPNHFCYLEMFRKAKGTAVALRWRDPAHGYLSDDTFSALLARVPREVRHWYRRIDVQAQVLNLYERTLRASLKSAEDALTLHEEHVHAA